MNTQRHNCEYTAALHAEVVVVKNEKELTDTINQSILDLFGWTGLAEPFLVDVSFYTNLQCNLQFAICSSFG